MSSILVSLLCVLSSQATTAGVEAPLPSRLPQRITRVESAYPTWSPDGTRILFQSNRSGRWHLYTIDGAGESLRQLTEGDSNEVFPCWSPDGTRIVCTSDRSGNEELWTFASDGSDARRLTDAPARDIHPYWTPDGTRILFNSLRDDPQHFEIYSVGPEGGAVTRLTRTKADETCAKLSPDGRTILYLINGPSGDQVCTMEAAGGAARVLANTSRMEGWPAWSPDGSRVVFSSARTGRFCLYLARADGSGVEQISDPGPGGEDARAAFSPDGRELVFNRRLDGGVEILRLRI